MLKLEVKMKCLSKDFKVKQIITIITLVALIGFGMAACRDPGCKCNDPCTIANCSCLECPGTGTSEPTCECDDPCVIDECECEDCPGIVEPTCECDDPCVIEDCDCDDCPGIVEPTCECDNPCVIDECECDDCPGPGTNEPTCECDNPCIIEDCDCDDCPGPGTSEPTCECDNPCTKANCECEDCPGTGTSEPTCECNNPCTIEDCDCPDCPNQFDSVITINTHPVSPSPFVFGAISGNLSVAASVTSGANLSYQWYRNSVNNTISGTLINGATNASYTIPTSLASATYYYYCVVSAPGEAAPVTSNIATVTINPGVISINGQPAALTTRTFNNITGSLTVTASVTGGAALSYQWYSNAANNNTSGALINGATSASYTILTTLASGTHYFYCIVSATGGAASVTSSVASVTVNPAPITNAAITVTAPAIDVTPSASASGTGNFSIGDVSWTPNDNPFKPNTAYTATVTLTAASNYTFTGLTTATINTNNAVITNNTGSAVTLSYTFGNTAVRPAANVTLDRTSVTMLVGGQTELLVPTVSPGDTTNKNVTWQSSNTAVATVSSNGTVTAVGAGTAIITVTTDDGTNRTAECTVTVQLNAGLTFTIAANNNAPVITGGTVYLPNAEDNPTTATITFENAHLYSNVVWTVSGTGISAIGPVFFINTTHSTFNRAGEYLVSVEALRGGIPYSRTVTFTVSE